jgi:uncharacterized damage-inducible protein DinB
MNTEIARIAYVLQQTYDGQPWHGSSVMSTLQNISVSQAYAHPLPDCHSIAELVKHVTAWRIFVWEKLRGNANYDISTPEQDWPVTVDKTEASWQQSLVALEVSQQKLLEILSKAKDEKLAETVPGREYNFYFLLHGIIQHDLYHLGQMAMLKKTRFCSV